MRIGPLAHYSLGFPDSLLSKFFWIRRFHDNLETVSFEPSPFNRYPLVDL